MKKQIDSKNYIFLDESGKPEVFSRKGTNLVQAGTASKYLVISAVRTNDHLAVQQAVTEYRLKLLKDARLVETFSPAYSLNAFHAQTDYPVVRKLFFEWIRDCPLDLKISVIVAEKLKAYPQLQQDAGRLYATVASQLLKRFLHTAEDIEVIFSRRDASLKARERLNLVVDTLRIAYAKDHEIEPKTTISYYHNPHYTHGGLQIADYVSHAVFKVFEKEDRQWYEIIKERIGYIQDIFNKKSYTRGSPL
jgi:predicted transcriptional regulator